MEMPEGAKIQVINNTPYVFFDTPYWNPIKKRGEHKRDYIGKVTKDGFVPNQNYFIRLQSECKLLKPGPVPATECRRLFYGATYLLDCIADTTGIADDLRHCFGSIGEEILSMAYYLVLEEGQPMYRFRKWGITHKHPYREDIPSQRSSEIFGMITEDCFLQPLFVGCCKVKM